MRLRRSGARALGHADIATTADTHAYFTKPMAERVGRSPPLPYGWPPTPETISMPAGPATHSEPSGAAAMAP